jgi:hypothetical protein
MTVENHAGLHLFSSKPASAEAWHVWTVIIPRRSITGRLVFGQVLSFDKFRTGRNCRPIWRERDFVGVAFES